MIWKVELNCYQMARIAELLKADGSDESIDILWELVDQSKAQRPDFVAVARGDSF